MTTLDFNQLVKDSSSETMGDGNRDYQEIITEQEEEPFCQFAMYANATSKTDPFQ